MLGAPSPEDGDARVLPIIQVTEDKGRATAASGGIRGGAAAPGAFRGLWCSPGHGALCPEAPWPGVGVSVVGCRGLRGRLEQPSGASATAGQTRGRARPSAGRRGTLPASSPLSLTLARAERLPPGPWPLLHSPPDDSSWKTPAGPLTVASTRISASPRGPAGPLRLPTARDMGIARLLQPGAWEGLWEARGPQLKGKEPPASCCVQGELSSSAEGTPCPLCTQERGVGSHVHPHGHPSCVLASGRESPRDDRLGGTAVARWAAGQGHAPTGWRRSRCGRLQPHASLPSACGPLSSRLTGSPKPGLSAAHS